ncbi:hypothetical protein ACWGID_27135 [Kribbella sp. NPDC054772]
MTNLPPHFVEVLANRLAEYTGQDLRTIRPTVRYAGDALAGRMADLMLDDVRRYVGDEHPEYLSARNRFVESVGPELRTVSPGVGTEVQRLQQARADADRVFALAVDVADPIGVAVEAPRSLEAQRAARITVAQGLIHGLPEGQTPTAERIGEWLADAGNDTQAFVRYAGTDLLRAAGDTNYEPRTSMRSGNETLRDGVARAWVRHRLPEIAAAVGHPLEPGDLDQLRYGNPGGIADGLVRAISSRSGKSTDEVLDRLCEAGDRAAQRGADQWSTARQLLVPQEALQSVNEGDRHLAGWRSVYAMEDEFKRHYGDSDRTPELTPEEAGVAIAEAGVASAERFGATVPGPAPAQRDPALDAAMNAAFVPSTGRSSSTAGHGERSTAARPTQQQSTQINDR